MKILLHDYAGHAFTAQLARALATVGHTVRYVSFAGFDSPKGKVAGIDTDPENFEAMELSLSEPLDKDNLRKRWLQQLEYARKIQKTVLDVAPDVVLSSAPVEVQEKIRRACHTIGAGFVFWVQDIHAEAIERVLVKKNKILGKIAGRYYRYQEAKTLMNSDAVIVISD